MGNRFEPAPFAEQKLATWDGLIPPLEVRVEAVAAEAIATAPVDSGKYKSSITSQVGFDERGKIIGRVRADDWKAAWIEFGTEKTRTHATLRKAFMSLGMTVKGTTSKARRSK